MATILPFSSLHVYVFQWTVEFTLIFALMDQLKPLSEPLSVISELLPTTELDLWTLI